MGRFVRAAGMLVVACFLAISTLGNANESLDRSLYDHSVLFISQLAGFAQMFGFAALFFGDRILPPALAENKGTVLIGLFVFSMVGQQMAATGAFEVLLDGVVLVFWGIRFFEFGFLISTLPVGNLVHSKLETGRMPSMQELQAGFSRFGVNPLLRE